MRYFCSAFQRCTAASRVIAGRNVVDEFQTRLVERVEKLRLGPGLEPATDVGPVSNPTQLAKIEGYMPVGLAEGARIATGGGRARGGGFAEWCPRSAPWRGLSI